MRKRIQDQIIDRRVADLLNPKLSWDATHTNLPGQKRSEVTNHKPKAPETVDNPTSISPRDFAVQLIGSWVARHDKGFSEVTLGPQGEFRFTSNSQTVVDGEVQTTASDRKRNVDNRGRKSGINYSWSTFTIIFDRKPNTFKMPGDSVSKAGVGS
jgi:hypothetical protein